MPKPLVYVAGPYGDAGGYAAVDKNISIARDACRWLAENGFFFLCPHMNSAHFEVIMPNVSVDHWYEQDLRLLDMCDGILLVGNWRESKGVQKELAVAVNKATPSFIFENDADRNAMLVWRDSWVSNTDPELEAS